MLNQEQNEKLSSHIWAAILKSVSMHSTTTKDIKEIKKNSEIRELFPSKTNVDEEANRLGISILNVLFHLNAKYGVDEKINYKPRTEYELFQTIEDIHQYFFDKYSKNGKVKEKLG